MDALDTNLLDIPTFEQILEYDESDHDREFSKSVVYQFIDQATETIPQLQSLLDERKFDDLSKRGHYLKGSSAQLGIKRVREQCELIQHYAALEDFKNNHAPLTHEKAIELLTETMSRLKREFVTARAYLRKLYGDKDSGPMFGTDSQPSSTAHSSATSGHSQSSTNPPSSSSSSFTTTTTSGAGTPAAHASAPVASPSVASASTSSSSSPSAKTSGSPAVSHKAAPAQAKDTSADVNGSSATTPGATQPPRPTHSNASK